MKKTLLILAAGMGSRFGGLKQIEPVGPNEEIILHYSIYDALKAGFNKIVLVIQEEHYEIFQKLVGEQLEGICGVEYVFQKNDNLSSFVSLPENKQKLYGIGHAIYCAEEKINENFGVINADDFYGIEAFEILSEELDKLKTNEFISINYEMQNVVPETGKLNRAKCDVKDGKTTKISGIIVKKEGNNYYGALEGTKEYFEIHPKTLTSMNMFGFTPLLFDYINNDIKEFFNKNKDNLLDVEYSLPKIVNDMIKKDLVIVKSCKTNSKWLGITYREDLEEVKNKIKEKYNNGEYPNKLFK